MSSAMVVFSNVGSINGYAVAPALVSPMLMVLAIAVGQSREVPAYGRTEDSIEHIENWEGVVLT